MRKALFILCIITIAYTISSCSTPRARYYYSLRGRVRHTNSRLEPPWYTFGGGRYNKDTKRVMKSWGRQYR
jgi:hypothetical protein